MENDSLIFFQHRTQYQGFPLVRGGFRSCEPTSIMKIAMREHFSKKEKKTEKYKKNSFEYILFKTLHNFHAAV